MKKTFSTGILAAALTLPLFAGCGGEKLSYYDYSQEGVTVGQIVGLDDDYIMGVDLSSVIEVENAGGKFYDAEGNEGDIFEILADYGVNYIRIRLWNDPFDENGNSFGGGGNDLGTDLEIAGRAVAAGLKVCLDFHYSDFWADPSKQTMPRAWTGYTYDALRQVVYDYTYETLKKFEEQGCLPSMVQTGNEINNGFLFDKGSAASWRNIYLYEALSAVKAVNPEIRTVIHLADGATYSTISGFVDSLIADNIDFDVIGLSYYSYWHGSMAKFQSCLEALDDKYDKDLCVMEYSYGYGDVSNAYTGNVFSSALEEAGGYKATVQGQASYIRDVNEAVASTSHGIGSFYWEPAWLPLAGTSWASEYAAGYLAAQGDGGGEGTVSWANQALFDFDGKPLDSLKAFRLMRKSGLCRETVLEIADEFSAGVDLSQAEIALPETTTAFTDLDRWTELKITWKKSDVSALTSAGTYTVRGTVECGGEEYPVICTATCYYDYLKNGSFEEDGFVADVKDFSLVTGWDMTGTAGSYRVETKNARSGKANVNIWCASAFENNLSQNLYNMTEGEYVFSVWARSASDSAAYPDCTLYVTVGGKTYEATVAWGASWSDWVQTSVSFTVTGMSDAVVGVRSTGSASSWAHFDDFVLSKI